MWVTKETDEYEKWYQWFEKKRWNELRAVVRNLKTYFVALQTGAKPVQIAQNYRFVHGEPNGVFAIDQKGGPKNLAETRLYVYPDIESEILYVLTIGLKDSQTADIRLCSQYVAQLQKRDSCDDKEVKDESLPEEATDDEATRGKTDESGGKTGAS